MTGEPQTQTQQPDQAQAQSQPQLKADRVSLRNQILTTKVTSQNVLFNGAEIEVRQPDLGAILDIRQESQQNEAEAQIRMIMMYCYVPGTDERLFEDGDEEVIKKLPFNADMRRLVRTLQSLVGMTEEEMKVALEEATKSSEG